MVFTFSFACHTQAGQNVVLILGHLLHPLSLFISPVLQLPISKLCNEWWLGVVGSVGVEAINNNKVEKENLVLVVSFPFAPSKLTDL